MSGWIRGVWKVGKKIYDTEAIKKVSVGKNLTKKRNIQDEQIKSRDKIISGLSEEGKINVRTKNPTYKFKQRISKIVDE